MRRNEQTRRGTYKAEAAKGRVGEKVAMLASQSVHGGAGEARDHGARRLDEVHEEGCLQLARFSQPGLG